MPKTSFLQVLSPEAVLYLKKIYEKDQIVRKKLTDQCQATLKTVQTYIRNRPPEKKTRKFSKEEVNAFNSMLDQMSKKVYRPKWNKEQ